MFALGVVGFMCGRWVHFVSPWGSFSSSGVIGFTRIRPRGRWVHPSSLDSLRFAMGVVGFVRVRWVGFTLGPLGSSGVVHAGGRSVHSCSLWLSLGSLYGSLG